jgi:hypothetical protein
MQEDEESGPGEFPRALDSFYLWVLKSWWYPQMIHGRIFHEIIIQLIIVVPSCMEPTICVYNNMVTSGTAQGGGGSFKIRKPIGEVGCCESEMAERSH